LSRPGIFINTAGDVRVLPQILDAASRFQAAPTEDEMRETIEQQEMIPLWPESE